MISEQELLAFIERILSNSPHNAAAEDRCRELLRVLEEQNLLSAEMKKTAETAIKSVPELYQVFPGGKSVTADGLEEAARRADERRRREEDARRYGRC